MRKLKLQGQLNQDQLLFFSAQKPDEQFFDLQKDPFELLNLIKDPDYRSLVEMFRKQMDATIAEFQSPNPTINSSPVDAGEVLDYVKYFEPQAYLRLLEGEEIGYHKFHQKYLDFKKNTAPAH
jgi:N-sulfoglucosamine sulfohydrolase